MFGGRNFGPGKEIEISTAGFVYDPASGEWSTLRGDFPVMAATALNFDGDIWLFGGVEKYFPPTLSTPDSHICYADTIRRPASLPMCASLRILWL